MPSQHIKTVVIDDQVLLTWPPLLDLGQVDELLLVGTAVAPELLGYPVPTAKVAPGGDHIIASADSPVPPILAAASESFAASSMKKAQSFRNRRLSIDAAAMSDATEAHRFAMRAPASDALLDEY